MEIKISRFQTILCTLLCFLLLPHPTKAEEMRGPATVSVLAASSLTNVLSELSSIYTRKRGVAVSISFDSSDKLATQIVEGEAADIFISAHTKWMSDLKQRGLIDIFSLANLARNSLVLVASKHIALNTRPIMGEDIAKIMSAVGDRAIPVIADPAEVPLGVYTKESLESLKLWEKFNDRVIRTENARAALYLIAKGETLGITYLSDATHNPEVDILAHFPETLHEPIIYQAAVVAGENMPRAREFLKFLESKEAKKVFMKYGFVVE